MNLTGTDVNLESSFTDKKVQEISERLTIERTELKDRMKRMEEVKDKYFKRQEPKINEIKTPAGSKYPRVQNKNEEISKKLLEQNEEITKKLMEHKEFISNKLKSEHNISIMSNNEISGTAMVKGGLARKRSPSKVLPKSRGLANLGLDIKSIRCDAHSQLGPGDSSPGAMKKKEPMNETISVGGKSYSYASPRKVAGNKVGNSPTKRNNSVNKKYNLFPHQAFG